MLLKGGTLWYDQGKKLAERMCTRLKQLEYLVFARALPSVELWTNNRCTR